MTTRFPVRAWMLTMACLLAPVAAAAVDPTVCARDGEREVPDFATGRDANGCLVIDPGNGDAPVQFQYSFFHETGLSLSSKDSGDSYSNWIDLELLSSGGCPTKGSGKYCTALVWDVTIDNYLSPAARNDDMVTMGAVGYEYLYFKNSRLINGWKCSSGTWSGPNNISCTSKSSAHSDGLQLRATMRNNGWFIFQDSVLANAHIALLRAQNVFGSPDVMTNMLFQGSLMGSVNTPMGLADHWIDDCNTRASYPGADAACEHNRMEGSMHVKEIWYVDVSGNARSKLGDSESTTKTVVVQTGPIQYLNGWPQPILRENEQGPGSCPNGLLDSTCTAGAPCYCYTSLERAFADGHKPPPFVHLSTAGWESPPSGASSARPLPPVLLP